MHSSQFTKGRLAVVGPALVSVLFTLVLSLPATADVWDRTYVGGTGDWVEGIDIGTGRNDGISRIYVSDDSGGVYEFSNIGTGWGGSLIGSVGAWGDGIALGAGRNDGITRAYSCSRSPLGVGHLDEFSYVDGNWVSATVGTGGRDDVVVGDGRNDGVTRVYGANDTFWEYAWQDGGWTKEPVGDVGFGEAIAIGSLRDDGGSHVYGVGSSFWEFTYTGGSWSKADVGFAGTTLRELTIGDGRNDGIQRAYAAGDNGHVYEFSYSSGNGWQSLDLGYSGGDYSHEVVVGDPYGDGVNRVYANGDSLVAEFVYDSGGWVAQTIGSLGSRARGLAIGDGRNDGATYVYAGNFGGQVYEFAIPEPATLWLLAVGGLLVAQRRR